MVADTRKVVKHHSHQGGYALIVGDPMTGRRDRSDQWAARQTKSLNPSPLDAIMTLTAFAMQSAELEER
jgi:hypothetical protein